MTKSQLNAISYAKQAARRNRQIKFIVEHDGSLDKFHASKYKSMLWYILATYNVRVY